MVALSVCLADPSPPSSSQACDWPPGGRWEVGAQSLSARDRAVPLPVSLHLAVCRVRPVIPGFLLRGAVGHSDERCRLKAFLNTVCLAHLRSQALKETLRLVVGHPDAGVGLPGGKRCISFLGGAF